MYSRIKAEERVYSSLVYYEYGIGWNEVEWDGSRSNTSTYQNYSSRSCPRILQQKTKQVFRTTLVCCNWSHSEVYLEVSVRFDFCLNQGVGDSDLLESGIVSYHISSEVCDTCRESALPCSCVVCGGAYRPCALMGMVVGNDGRLCWCDVTFYADLIFQLTP